jgi:hypothetical protein
MLIWTVLAHIQYIDYAASVHGWKPNLHHIQIVPRADSRAAAESQQPFLKTRRSRIGQQNSDEHRSEASHSRMSNQIQLW